MCDFKCKNIPPNYSFNRDKKTKTNTPDISHSAFGKRAKFEFPFICVSLIRITYVENIHPESQSVSEVRHILYDSFERFQSFS